MSTAQTWLECLEIVGAVALNATFWAAAKVPLAYLLMVDDHAAMGLVGFAHAYTIATCFELVTMYLIVVVWKKARVASTCRRPVGGTVFGAKRRYRRHFRSGS